MAMITADPKDVPHVEHFSFTPEYTRRPGVETRRSSRMTGRPSKYLSEISSSGMPFSSGFGSPMVGSALRARS